MLSNSSVVRRLLVVGAVGALGLFGAEACSLGSDTYITTEPGIVSGADAGASTPNGSPGGGGADACKREFAKVDLAALEPCGSGKGHCYEKGKTPYAEQFAACEDANAVCVPDEILQAGGEALKTCTSVIGKGGCITSALLPELEKRAAGALKQDACNAGQLCVPCVDPTNGNAPTPFCQPIGVYDKVCEGGTGAGPGGTNTTPPPAAPLPACCTTNGKSNGVCLAETAIPEASREDAPADTCAAGNKCVPKALVDGAPVKCKAGAILGAGVCMDRCFNGMMGFAETIGVLDRDVCTETEVCVPCSFVSDMGVPGCK